MHPLLERQLRRFIGPLDSLPDEWRQFLGAVDDAYRHTDADRAQLERSLDTVSAEMVARYEDLHDALSDSQRAETRLTNALATLAATIESTTDGMLVVDATGATIRWNEKALTVLDLRDATALADGAPLAPAIAALLDDADAFLRRVAELTGRSDDESFDTLRTRDGRTLEVYSQPLRVDGAIVGRVWSVRDVSARVALEERVRHGARIEAVGQLAGGVAHDFNNLLTVICSSCELLAESLPPGSPQRDEVAEIQAASSRAVQLTRQLLTFSRRHVVQPVRVRIAELVDQLCPMLTRLIGEHIQLSAVTATGVDAVVMDRGQLEQVIVNLVVNARDALPRGGSIRIGVENAEVGPGESVPTSDGSLSPGSYVRLSVRDDGCGIPSEILPRIFEPFFTSKTAGDGTGLGLATVSTIVREAGGRIAVRTVVDQGTTFDVYLPSTAGGDQEPSGPRLVPRAMAGTETILIVDDDERVRAVMQRVLERHHYNVIVKRSGNEALAVATESDRTIDLVISDVVMPGLSGIELRECLRELRPATKVLLVSGYTNTEIGRRGYLPPDTRILQKPFAGPDLLAAVRSVLDYEPARSECTGAVT